MMHLLTMMHLLAMMRLLAMMCLLAIVQLGRLLHTSIQVYTWTRGSPQHS